MYLLAARDERVMPKTSVSQHECDGPTVQHKPSLATIWPSLKYLRHPPFLTTRGGHKVIPAEELTTNYFPPMTSQELLGWEYGSDETSQ